MHVTIRKGSVLRTAEKEVKLTKINSAPPQPAVLEVKDSVSGTVDTTLTAHTTKVRNLTQSFLTSLKYFLRTANLRQGQDTTAKYSTSKKELTIITKIWI
ncbi:hypothetical protein FACS189456_7290 [Bacteroidia bacterium]|nr:hypothetical protein FACS189456_7290 [Bacteroidia bacterium]